MNKIISKTETDPITILGSIFDLHSILLKQTTKKVLTIIKSTKLIRNNFQNKNYILFVGKLSQNGFCNFGSFLFNADATKLIAFSGEMRTSDYQFDKVEIKINSQRNSFSIKGKAYSLRNDDEIKSYSNNVSIESSTILNDLNLISIFVESDFS